MSSSADPIPAPLDLHREIVRPEWIDYNGHMNVGYYGVAFDHATDVLLDHLGIGQAYRQRTECSIFIVEQHLLYKAELKLGDRLRVATQLIANDDKRIHYFHWMYHDAEGYLAATAELLALHVDLSTRRAAPMPEAARARLAAMAAAHAALPRPAGLGRIMGIAGEKPR